MILSSLGRSVPQGWTAEDLSDQGLLWIQLSVSKRCLGHPMRADFPGPLAQVVRAHP